MKSNDLVFRLRKRAEIRKQITTRKSVQNNEPDRIADLLEEAATALEQDLDTRSYLMGRYDTSPVKELTDEEIEDCFPENGCSSTEDGFGLVVSAQFLHDFARAILRKAQEK